MQFERGAGGNKESFPILGDLPAQEHRHRHGPGADGRDPAGRRQPLRDRQHPPDPRSGRGAERPALRGQPAKRRPAAGGRRPRPDGDDADRRRRDAFERRPRLRAAPDPAPHRAQHAAARCARPDDARTRRDAIDGDGAVVPRASSDRDRIARSPRRGGRRSSRRSGRARRIFDTAVPEARQARHCRRAARSSCTTPTASRST